MRQEKEYDIFDKKMIILSDHGGGFVKVICLLKLAAMEENFTWIESDFDEFRKKK